MSEEVVDSPTKYRKEKETTLEPSNTHSRHLEEEIEQLEVDDMANEMQRKKTYSKSPFKKNRRLIKEISLIFKQF